MNSQGHTFATEIRVNRRVGTADHLVFSITENQEIQDVLLLCRRKFVGVGDGGMGLEIREHPVTYAVLGLDRHEEILPPERTLVADKVLPMLGKLLL